MVFWISVKTIILIHFIWDLLVVDIRNSFLNQHIHVVVLNALAMIKPYDHANLISISVFSFYYFAFALIMSYS